VTRSKTVKTKPGQRPRKPSTVATVTAVASRTHRRWWAASIAIVVLAAVSVGVGLNARSTEAASNRPAAAQPLPLESVAALGRLAPPGYAGAIGPEGLPIAVGPTLAPPDTTGRAIDGIGCSTGEQVAYHIHIHLTVFVNGVAEEVPAAVGIANPEAQSTPQGPFIGSGSCFYWLHTHAADGIIHVESPVRATYNLGQFFDIWGEPLNADKVGPAAGAVTAFYNGQHWTGNPRDIPLNAHAQIQLDVGSPLVAPESIRFPNGL
jgi:hypothetical protein